MPQGPGTYGSKRGRPSVQKRAGFKMRGWSPFTQKPKGKLTEKQKEELEAKGAELSPPDRYDAHNTNARKMECADKGGKWVEVSPGKFECK